MSNFAVKTNTFEGPFDALLQMIEKKKLHISTVSLAQIADDYMQYVRENEFRLREGTLFVWTAATLMLIKSKHLLPAFVLTDEESEDVGDLEKRLAIYAIYSKQADKLQSILGKKVIWNRIYRKQTVVQFRPDPRISPEYMRSQFEDIFQTVQDEIFTPIKSVQSTRSLKEITDSILARIAQYTTLTFKELSKGLDRKETAVSFLAVLEQFKQGRLVLSQDRDFERITVEHKRSF